MPQLLERHFVIEAWPGQPRDKGRFGKGKKPGGDADKAKADAGKVQDIKDKARLKRLGLDKDLTDLEEHAIRDAARRNPKDADLQESVAELDQRRKNRAIDEQARKRDREVKKEAETNARKLFEERKKQGFTKPGEKGPADDFQEIARKAAEKKTQADLARIGARTAPAVKLVPKSKGVLGTVTSAAERVPGVRSVLSALGIGTGSVIGGAGSLVAKIGARMARSAAQLGVHGALGVMAASSAIAKAREDGIVSALPSAAWAAWEGVMFGSQVALMGRLGRLNGLAKARAGRHAARIGQRQAALAASEAAKRPAAAKAWDAIKDFATGRRAIPGS